MNRVRLYLHRLFRRPAITGPMRLYTRRVPDGVFLDLTDYFEHVIETLTDDEEALALLLEIAEDRGNARQHDGWEPEKLLVEKLALIVGYEVPVREKALGLLIRKLQAAAPGPRVSIPAQREAGAA
ncbi:hypothetical protein ACWDE0_21800 [Streptomyces sp. 900105755]